MTLKSALLSGDPHLEAAAVSDRDHITPGSRGDHVMKIQQALNQVSDARLEEDGVYGASTAKAVSDYKRKHQPQILNYAGRIDDVVGIKTLAWLDRELPKPGGLNLNFDITLTILDVVVNFNGQPSAALKSPDEALTKAQVGPIYDPVPSSPNGMLLRHKTNNNLLLRIAHDVTDFGVRGMPVLMFVTQKILDEFKKTDPDNGNPLLLGKILVFGTSSGGRCALEFAAALARTGTVPRFVAAIDASFSQVDTDDRPDLFPPLNVPDFKLGKIMGGGASTMAKIPERHNFYQKRGNHVKRTNLQRLHFTSKMKPGLEEIHGTIESFKPHEISPPNAIPNQPQNEDDQFHEFACPAGRLDTQKMILKELT